MISLQKIQHYKWYIVIGGILLACVIVILTVFITQNDNDSPSRSVAPSPTPALVQAPFTVIATNPTNNAVGVYAGELLITITTDVQVLSQESFSFSLSPKSAHTPRIENAYPTTSLKIRIIGGLQPNTVYTGTLTDKKTGNTTTWTFTTSSDRGQAQSGFRTQLDDDINKTYYPLITFIPYKTASYTVGYANRLTLKITITRQGTNQNEAVEQVKEWVRSKGIDPNTHQYQIVNNF